LGRYIKGFGFARIFKAIANTSKTVRTALPKVLSLDEVSTKKRHKYATVISAPKEKRVIELVKGRAVKEIKEAFGQYSPAAVAEVKVVVIDRSKVYRKAVKEILPSAKIVVDKYHLVQDVNKALDQLRKRCQSKLPDGQRKKLWGSRFLLLKNCEDLTPEEEVRLATVLSNCLALSRGYQLIEGFRRVLNRRFQDFLFWELKAKGSHLPEFVRLGWSFGRWNEEIRNYYRYGDTNGYAEGINNTIKVIKRRAYGFRNDDSFRLRVLAVCG